MFVLQVIVFDTSSLYSPSVHLVDEAVGGVPERLKRELQIGRHAPHLLGGLRAQSHHLAPGPLDRRVQLHEP